MEWCMEWKSMNDSGMNYDGMNYGGMNYDGMDREEKDMSKVVLELQSKRGREDQIRADGLKILFQKGSHSTVMKGADEVRGYEDDITVKYTKKQ